ncbi:hypothetical protein [Priestia aryabhattai]|uniref:hypothetical protein n=1 Tax=Priestia aryabhattai TaxID=412384 RepID=UPI002E1B16EB|nr:hypothetical protein [Priestia aryabhattai]
MICINGNEYPTYEFKEIDRNRYVGFIYITINKLNGKKYIGQHSAWLNWYVGSGEYLKNAINKYGKWNFERHIIYLAESQMELDEAETFFINEGFGENAAKSKRWYNIKDGSQKGGNSLVGLSEEDLKRRGKKISEAQYKAFDLFKDNKFIKSFDSVTEAISFFGGKSRNCYEAKAIAKLIQGYKYSKGRFEGYSISMNPKFKNISA